METPTTEQLERLPKWAQQYIEDLGRQRDVAVRHVEEMLDEQTPSPFYVDELTTYGPKRREPGERRSGVAHRRRYVQTHKMTVEWEGVQLTIILRDGLIDLSYSSKDGALRPMVNLIPSSYQQIYLKRCEVIAVDCQNCW